MWLTYYTGSAKRKSGTASQGERIQLKSGQALEFLALREYALAQGLLVTSFG